MDDDAPHDGVPDGFRRVDVLPFPRSHARRMTVMGFVLAAMAYGLVTLLLSARGTDPVFHQNGYTVLFFVAALALVPLHEGLHVLAALVLGMPWGRIQLGFRRGFIYVRFHRSLSVGAMRVVLLTPLVLLGLLLLVFCLRSMDRQWLVLLCAHVGSTVVDLYTWWRLRGIDGGDHVFQEPGVQGLSVFRGPPEPALDPRPAPALASGVLVSTVTLVLFLVGPFLVPSHELLGDRTLRRQRDLFTGRPVVVDVDSEPTTEARAGGSDRPDAASHEAGWQRAAYDFHVTDARAVRCTARAWRAGRLLRRETTEIPVASSSGRLFLSWGLWPPGDGPGRFAVRLAHGGRDLELLSVAQEVTARSRVLSVADDHDVRLGHSLPVLHRFVTSDELPAEDRPAGHVAGSSPDRGGLPPGLEVEVRLTFVGEDDGARRRRSRR